MRGEKSTSSEKWAEEGSRGTDIVLDGIYRRHARFAATAIDSPSRMRDDGVVRSTDLLTSNFDTAVDRAESVATTLTLR